MKASELRQLSDEELRKKELDLREDLFKLQFQHKIRSLENPARLRQIRKDIARVHTVLTEQAQA
ncbi:MAG: 50S ribosomal protein L29 [Candidatus Electrothrix sp. AR1]|nr:50S ribosomal protein L29 [Candidatus Electrothrix sp. AR1]